MILRAFLCVTLAFAARANAQGESLTCTFYGNTLAPSLVGTATLKASVGSTDVTITLNVANVSNSNSTHSVIIYEQGDTLDSTGANLRGHWSPTGEGHGCPGVSSNWDSGDLGNWNATDGLIDRSAEFSNISLSGAQSIAGRVIAIHNSSDSCVGADGDAGPIIAMCVLGLTNTANNAAFGEAPPGSLFNAVAKLQPTPSDPGVSGEVFFSYVSSGSTTVTTVTARIFGLVNGSLHGFHIHTYGEYLNTGVHFNPTSVTHGIPRSGWLSHVGDLGNVISYADDGTAWFQAAFTDIKFTGSDSILGRAIAVHALEDTCTGLSGNAGSQLATGIVAHTLSSAVPTPPSVDPLLSTPQSTANCPLDEIAVCRLYGTQHNPTATGTAIIRRIASNVVRLTINATGLVNTSMDRGVHVHEFGDETDSTGASMGSHLDTGLGTHGCFPNATRHLGDTGNWHVDNSGALSFSKDLDLLELTGTYSVLGRGLVIHAQEDDCANVTSSGIRLATCTFGVPSGTTLSELSAPSNAANAEGVATIYPIRAVATLRDTATATDTIFGVVYFEQDSASAPTIVTARINPSNAIANNSIHALHVHEFGDLLDATGNRAGSHYNPFSSEHSIPGSGYLRHVGDLGNIRHYEADGTAWFRISNDLMSLNGSMTIIGRAVVLHSNSDDCTQSVGNAGARIAAGVIGIASSAIPAVPSGVPSTQDFSACPIPERAACRFYGTSADPTVSGVATFVRVSSSEYEMTLDVSGITINASAMHGVHIHEFGDASNLTGISAGSHWNPSGNIHGCPPGVRHNGDTGNWQAIGGNITGSKRLDLLELTGDKSIIGRAVILHALQDDCANVPSAGARLAVCVIGLSSDPNPAAAPTSSLNMAVAVIQNEARTIRGTVWFEQTLPSSPTVITASISGLNNSVHGFHVHEFGDLLMSDASRFGSHYNPTGTPHSIPGSGQSRHVGDMGNIENYDSDGVAWYHFSNELISLNGPNSIIGRGVVLHVDPDTCGQPTGNAGLKLAFGVIGIGNPSTAVPSVAGLLASPPNVADCQVAVELAHCRFRAIGSSLLTGTATLRSVIGSTVDLQFDLSGLSPAGTHAVRITTYGDLQLSNGGNLGAVWNGCMANPGNVHGCPETGGDRACGDAGNIIADGYGNFISGKTFDMIELTGNTSVIGRGLAIYDVPDDCINGVGSSTPIAMCVFGLANPTMQNIPAQLATAPDATEAVCQLTGLVGTIWLTDTGTSTLIVAKITDRDPHGMHIHEWGDQLFLSFNSTGSHYNPTNSSHNIPGSTYDRHVGDLGNVGLGGTLDGISQSWYTFSNPLVSLSGVFNVIGRSIVIHTDPDTCVQPTGNSGPPLASCVIGLRSPLNTPDTVPSNLAQAAGTQTFEACPPPSSTGLFVPDGTPTGDSGRPIGNSPPTTTVGVSPSTALSVALILDECGLLTDCAGCTSIPDCVWCAKEAGDVCVQQDMRETCDTWYFAQCAFSAHMLGSSSSYLIVLILTLIALCCIVPIAVFISCKFCRCGQGKERD